MKEKMKMVYKCMALLLICVMTISMSDGETVFAAIKETAVNKAYKKYIKTIKEKKIYKDGLYAAIIKNSESGLPILLVSSTTYNDGKERHAISAKVYNYVDGKVTYITTISSTGTAYPICAKEKYLLVGEHHTSTRVVIAGKKAYFQMVSGIYMEIPVKCYKISWTEIAGKEKKNSRSKKEISRKQAEKSDYYYNSVREDYQGKPIIFKKY